MSLFISLCLIYICGSTPTQMTLTMATILYNKLK